LKSALNTFVKWTARNFSEKESSYLEFSQKDYCLAEPSGIFQVAFYNYSCRGQNVQISIIRSLI
jgi:hypothetical protein